MSGVCTRFDENNKKKAKHEGVVVCRSDRQHVFVRGVGVQDEAIRAFLSSEYC